MKDSRSSSLPCGFSTPWRSNSAAVSIRPEPQSPTGATLPITLMRRWPSATTFSIAPVLPRMPQEIRAPSKAGPAAVDAAVSWPFGPEDDFAVGADIDQERGACRFDHARGDDARRGVAADESADDGKHIRPAARMNPQAQFRRARATFPGRPPARTALRPGCADRCRRAGAAWSVLPAKVIS